MKTENKKNNNIPIPEGWKMRTLGGLPYNVNNKILSQADNIEGWKTKMLGEVITLNTGKLDSNRAENNGSFPFFTCAPNPLKINSYAFNCDAILLAGNNANGIFHINRYNGKFNAYQRTYVITTANQNIDIDFLYYSLQLYLNYLKDISQGSATKFLTVKILKDIKIDIPIDIKEQKQIAKILSSLDDKIELLREQNKTLEAIAQAIYKQWFVDFEFPIEDETSKLLSLKRGEPEGRGGFDNILQLKGYKSSGGKMVKSELGEIPEGWRIGVLNDLCEKLESGGTPPTSNEEYWNGEINWFSTKELQDNFIFESKKKITKKGLENSSAKIYPKGSVVMAIYAAPTVGHLGLLGVDSTFNQAACGFIADDKVASNEFIYSFLLHSRNVFINLSNGAAQQNLNVGLVRNFKLIISNNETMKKFNVFSKPIFLKILNNFSQIQTLSALRDSLLPKLMSGKIRVPVKNEAETTTSAEGCHPSLTGGELKSENPQTEGE